MRASRKDVSRKSPDPEERSRRSRNAAISMSLQRASMKYRSRVRSLDRAGISGVEGVEVFMGGGGLKKGNRSLKTPVPVLVEVHPDVIRGDGTG